MSRNKETIMKWGNIKTVITSILPLIEADVICKNMQLATDFREVSDILLGSGIGQEVLGKLLRVCNSIAERHNAKLQIISSTKGSSFEVHFRIPLKE